MVKLWWEQDGLDMEVMRTADQEAVQTKREEETYGTDTEMYTDMDMD